tara:strand:+ start:2531 stop:3013 length:483 start_codon:yes stop_codon:yes gene_type:complete
MVPIIFHHAIWERFMNKHNTKYSYPGGDLVIDVISDGHIVSFFGKYSSSEILQISDVWWGGNFIHAIVRILCFTSCENTCNLFCILPTILFSPLCTRVQTQDEFGNLPQDVARYGKNTKISTQIMNMFGLANSKNANKTSWWLLLSKYFTLMYNNIHFND